MRKSLVAMSAAFAVASLISGQASAGASASAASKYGHANATTNRTTNVAQIRTHRPTQSAELSIGEFSSSSAKTSVPKR